MAIIGKFSAAIIKSPSKGGWTYVIWPESQKVLGTRGAVKVRGTCDGEPLETSFMAMGGLGANVADTRCDFNKNQQMRW